MGWTVMLSFALSKATINQVKDGGKLRAISLFSIKRICLSEQHILQSDWLVKIHFATTFFAD